MNTLTGPRVLVIGELNVDIVASGLRGTPQMGTEIVASDCQLTLGSASAIFAAGVAKLGHPVTFVSQVGKDNLGDFCIQALQASGVSTKNVSRQVEVKTGVTIALSKPQDRALVTYPGAIENFKYEPLNTALLKEHQHLHMTSYFLQKALRPSFPQVFRDARELGLTTSFDPNSDPTDNWTKSIRRVLRHTDVLFVNQFEALQLTQAGTVLGALKNLGELVSCAVIKLGRRGAIAIRGNEVIRAAGFRIKALDTTGAGDSFDAGFISAYLRGATLGDCLRQGNACGALSTRKPGGTAGQPNGEQLKKFLRSEKQSQTPTKKH